MGRIRLQGSGTRNLELGGSKLQKFSVLTTSERNSEGLANSGVRLNEKIAQTTPKSASELTNFEGWFRELRGLGLLLSMKKFKLNKYTVCPESSPPCFISHLAVTQLR